MINVPVTSKIETPKKRPLEATLAVAPTVQSVQPAIQSQTLNRHGGLNTSIMSQGSNGGNASFHDLNGPAAKRARLARGGLRICAKVSNFLLSTVTCSFRMCVTKSLKKEGRRISKLQMKSSATRWELAMSTKRI